MKRTPENLEILKKLGFSCDFDKTGHPDDKDWFSLKDGWGFRLDTHKNFASLFKAALDYTDLGMF